MPDILAIVSKAVFERDARVDDQLVAPGDVWPTDRYTSCHKTFDRLADGGRIFLVTVRPPHEQLWFVGVIDGPVFEDEAWVAREPNALPVTNISALRKSITFESGKGISQDKGTLGMSLQTPRALTASDVEQILGVVSGVVSGAVDLTMPAVKLAKSGPARVIGGKYEILKELGKGGMGVVYLARHTGTGRRVALKEIMRDSLGDKTMIERFYREARATSSIETRHITPVLDTGSDPETQNPYLVMELLTGEDLQTFIDRRGVLEEELAVKIVGQACIGLARAHAAGVIHRDIKPANLFLHRLDGEVVVKLLDFGVARVSVENNRALTATGVMLGTPLYMSPEQVVGAKNLDHRTDVWSLGIVLYEALTGVTPYDEIETIGGLLVAICSRPPRVPKHVPGPIATVLSRSLALDPADRYATADDMLADLRAIVPAGLALAEGAVGPLPPPVPEAR
ncbi:MAG: serine/threonine-protein kinase [Kofleriaceae bacterium]